MLFFRHVWRILMNEYTEKLIMVIKNTCLPRSEGEVAPLHLPPPLPTHNTNTHSFCTAKLLSSKHQKIYMSKRLQVLLSFQRILISFQIFFQFWWRFLRKIQYRRTLQLPLYWPSTKTTENSLISDQPCILGITLSGAGNNIQAQLYRFSFCGKLI